ncbi:MAG: hypothetical protein Q4E36_02905 [Bacillota bacterium]|nr:hypothetical protein [Bacillota bacterium]
MEKSKKLYKFFFPEEVGEGKYLLLSKLSILLLILAWPINNRIFSYISIAFAGLMVLVYLLYGRSYYESQGGSTRKLTDLHGLINLAFIIFHSFRLF